MVATRTVVTAHATHTVATLTWRSVHPLGNSFGQTSKALVRLVLCQVTSSDMLLDVRGLRLDNCIDDGFDSNPLVGGNIGDALAGIACGLQYFFAHAESVGQHRNPLGPPLGPLLLSSFTLLLCRSILGIGNARCNCGCA